MSKRVVSSQIGILGRFGNWLGLYAHSKDSAAKIGATLATHPWIGRQLFELDDPIADGSEEEVERAPQFKLTRSIAKTVFRFRREVWDAYPKKRDWYAAALLRRGDLLTPDCPFPVIDDQSFKNAFGALGVPLRQVIWVQEELSIGNKGYLDDFMTLVKADLLLTPAISTFGIWAALLGDGKAYKTQAVPGEKGIIRRDFEELREAKE